ncbi:MAG: helix-turn-helix transcriptional regulator [Saprospiraceae bacterium]|nr:helix-turn-helix transcriptional regulator [Saprospiraceae bacterium]MBP7699428.1 helix-turn-helix transcriptional regulator [Saprospiraceae bacterium]
MYKYFLTIGFLVAMSSMISFSNTAIESISDASGFPPICEQIKNARLQKNMSADKLALLTGLHAGNILAIESGKAQPTKDILFKMQTILNTDFVLDAK